MNSFNTMNQINTKFQIVLFGSFEDIDPSIENMKFFFNTFSDKGFIPNVVNEVNLKVTNNDFKSDNINRVSLVKNDGEFIVKINTGTIELIVNNKNVEGVENQPNIDDFVTESIEIIKTIVTQFPKKFKRIGLVTQYFIKNLSVPKTHNEFSSEIEFMRNKRLVEFNQRILIREPKNISNSYEEFNISKDIKLGKQVINRNNLSPSVVEGFLITLDINTVPENLNFRFDTNSITEFTEIALEINNTIISQLNNKIK